MTGGTYTLVVAVASDARVEIGALGDHEFDADWYAYTGSAFGPGGFARVDRHHELAAGEREVRHWHVDYLLAHPAARIATVVRSPGVDAECAVASALPDGPVTGFGASDCDCRSHLAVFHSKDDAVDAVRTAHPEGRE